MRGYLKSYYDASNHLKTIKIEVFRVRGSSNGLTNHPGGDVYRGLLVHAGLLLVVVVVAPQGGHFGLIVLRHTASLFCHQRGSQSSYGALVNGI